MFPERRIPTHSTEWRTIISPKLTLITEGHPVEPAERNDFTTVAPIVIEANVWIGAAATILPGVTIGHDAVVGAGAVVAKDAPPLTVVTGHGAVVLARPNDGALTGGARHTAQRICHTRVGQSPAREIHPPAAL